MFSLIQSMSIQECLASLQKHNKQTKILNKIFIEFAFRLLCVCVCVQFEYTQTYKSGFCYVIGT